MARWGRLSRALVVCAVSVALLGVLAACSSGGNGGGGESTSSSGGSKGTIKVGSKIDVEGPLLGQIIIAMLEKNGYTAEDKTRTGATDVVRKALTSGEIDIYPEYTANAILIFNKSAKVDPSILKDAKKTYETAKSLDASYGVVWLGAAPANNTWGLAIPKKLATGQNITTFQEWADYVKGGGQVKVAGSQEFFDSAAAFPAFEKVYGFKLTNAQKVVLATGDTAVTEKAAAQGTNGVNAAMAYGTDGTIAALDLQWLRDDKGAQPVYQPAPTVRKEIADKYTDLGSILDPVFAKLDDQTLQQLNGKIAVDGQDAKTVARDWLKSQGFIE